MVTVWVNDNIFKTEKMKTRLTSGVFNFGDDDEEEERILNIIF